MFLPWPLHPSQQEMCGTLVDQITPVLATPQDSCCLLPHVVAHPPWLASLVYMHPIISSTQRGAGTEFESMHPTKRTSSFLTRRVEVQVDPELFDLKAETQWLP